MSKTFTPKPGDKWTRDEDGMLWVYRKDCAVVFSRTGFTAGPVTCRSAHERDLPTPDAHAQLREWGYEVTCDAVTSTTTPSGMVIETRYVFPGEYRIDPPITESRVREIVAQMLAAQPTPAEVREAAKVASDPQTKWVDVKPEPDWKGLLANLVEAWKQSYFSGTEAVDRVVNFNTSPALAAAREHLARTNGGGK